MGILILMVSVLFYKPFKASRELSVSFSEYVVSAFFDIVLIFLPAAVSITLGKITGNTTLYLVGFIGFLIAFNGIYPYILKLRFQCKKYKIEDFEELPQMIDNIKARCDCDFKAYIYNGKSFRSANALVAGLPWDYQIFLSDYLIDNFSWKEIEAILLHEVGHIKKHHLIIRSVIIILQIPILFAIAASMDEFLKPDNAANMVIGSVSIFLFLISYNIFVFLYTSRTQENKADFFAITNGSDLDTLSSALIKLSELNFLAAQKNKVKEWTGTHPSLERRINYLKNKKEEMI
jgi:STE24 endopeptidase